MTAVDDSLPWRWLVQHPGMPPPDVVVAPTSHPASPLPPNDTNAQHTLTDEPSTAFSTLVDLSMPAHHVLRRGVRMAERRKSATSRNGRMQGKASWLQLAADADASKQQQQSAEGAQQPPGKHELSRVQSAFLPRILSPYENNVVEDEFWRFAVWRVRWEIPLATFAFGLTFLLRLNFAKSTELAVIQGVCGVVLLLGSFAFLGVIIATRKRRPNQMVGVLRVLRRASAATQMIALACCITTQTLGYSNCVPDIDLGTNNCVRQFPASYVFFLFATTFTVQSPKLVMLLLVLAHSAAIVAFSRNANYDTLTLALFGTFGYCIVLHFAAWSVMQMERHRAQFELQVTSLLGMWDTEEQAAALLDIGTVAVPVHIAERLRDSLSLAADHKALQKLVYDAQPDTLVAGVAMKQLTGDAMGHVMAMARCVSLICHQLDAHCRGLRLDTAGVIGDCYLLTSGLHTEACDDAGVAMLLRRLLDVVEYARAHGGIAPTWKSARVQLSAAVVRGAATGLLVGDSSVRYTVTGSAVVDCVQAVDALEAGFVSAPSQVLAHVASGAYDLPNSPSTVVVLPLEALDDPIGNPRHHDNPFVEAGDGANASSTSEFAPTTPRDSGTETDTPSSTPRGSDYSVPVTSEQTHSSPRASRRRQRRRRSSRTATSQLPPMPPVTWYGRFSDPEFEEAFQAYCRAHCRPMYQWLGIVMSIIGCACVAMVVTEQLVDSKLSSKTPTWALVLAIGSLCVAMATSVIVSLLSRSRTALTPTVAIPLCFFLCACFWPLAQALPGSFLCNRPTVLMMVLLPPLFPVLRHHLWPLATMVLLISVGPLIGAGYVVKTMGVGNSIVVALFMVVFGSWLCRAVSLDARHRFADLARIRVATSNAVNNAVVLHDIAVSLFPSAVVPRVFEALLSRSASFIDPVTSDHYPDLVVCRVTLAPQHAAYAADLFAHTAAMLAQAPQLAQVQAVGNSMLILCGFDKGAVAVSAAKLALLLHRLRCKAEAAGAVFTAGVAVEEAQGVLAGNRLNLRYCVVGKAQRIATALAKAFEAPPSSCTRSIVAVTSAFVDLVGRQRIRDVDAATGATKDVRFRRARLRTTAVGLQYAHVMLPLTSGPSALGAAAV